MSVWKDHKCKTPLSKCPYRSYVPEKIDELFKELPNVFGIADDILVVGYGNDVTNHNVTLHRIL